MLCGAGLASLAIHELFAYDVWWQVRAGEWIARHGIPAADPFSYAFADREWIEPRWLWCLALHAIADGLGLNYLILAKLALLGLAFVLLARTARPGAEWAAPLGWVMALAAGHERFLVRPELVSFVGLALTLLCLERFRQGRAPAWIYVLPPVQIVWCNAHTLWILGPAVLWIVVVGEWLEAGLAPRLPRLLARADGIREARLARLALVAAGSSIAAAANPYLLRGAAFPFRLFAEISGGHLLNETIGEFRGPFTAEVLAWDLRLACYLAVLALSAAAFVWNRRRLSLSRAALWLAFLLLSIKAQRNVALFGFVAAYTTMRNLGECVVVGSTARRVRGAARAAAAILLLVTIPLAASDLLYRYVGSSKRFGFGVSDHRFPVRALRFVREAGLPLPVLNTLGDGGYVLFDGGPRSVYIDGRLEVYGAEILSRALRATWTGEGLEEESRRTSARTVLVPNRLDYRPLLRFLEGAADWVPVYYDHLHLVYLKVDPTTRGLAERLAVDWQRPHSPRIERPSRVAPPDWLAGLWPRAADSHVDERLGSLLAGVGSYDRALEHFEAAHRRTPRDRRVRLFLGLFREARGDAAAAERLLRGLPSTMLEQVDVRLLAGRLCLWGGRPRRAMAHLERAIALGAPQPDTSLRLARATILAGELERAELLLDTLARDHPQSPKPWNLRAVIATRRQRPEEAIRAFETSLGIQPRQPDVYRALAGLYRQVGQPDRATEMLERARALAPPR